MMVTEGAMAFCSCGKHNKDDVCVGGNASSKGDDVDIGITWVLSMFIAFIKFRKLLLYHVRPHLGH